MAQTFNLADYETVEERIRKLYDLHPDARIITENLTTLQDRQASTWVVKAEVWLPISDFKFITAPLDGGIDSPAELWVLKATGMAFEVDGSGMTQRANALETCETSAIGRALANMNLSGSKRASRTEMEKAQRGVTPKPPRDWEALTAALETVDAARALYNEARTAKAPQAVLEAITAKAKNLG